MATQVNSIKHRKNSYRFFWNSFKRMKRKEYSQRHSIKPPLSWYQNQRQTLLKKKKLQANILDEYRFKNSQQNISEWKLTQKKDHTPRPRWTHLRIITTVQHMQINQWETARQQEKRQKPHAHLKGWRKSIWSNIHSQWKLLWHKDAHSCHFIQHSTGSLSHKKM